MFPRLLPAITSGSIVLSVRVAAAGCGVRLPAAAAPSVGLRPVAQHVHRCAASCAVARRTLRSSRVGWANGSIVCPRGTGNETGIIGGHTMKPCQRYPVNLRWSVHSKPMLLRLLPAVTAWSIVPSVRAVAAGCGVGLPAVAAPSAGVRRVAHNVHRSTACVSRSSSNPALKRTGAIKPAPAA